MRLRLGALALLLAAVAIALAAVLPAVPRPGRQALPVLARGPVPPGVTPVVLRKILRKDISGPIVGELLTSTQGTWSNSPTSYFYQWFKCSSGAGCQIINGATTGTYTVSSNDVGYTIYAQVSACNGSGCASQNSNISGVVGSSGGSLLFDGTFEFPTAGGSFSPWNAALQCANASGKPGSGAHYWGNFYFDGGGSASASAQSGEGAGTTTFNGYTANTVPPYAGNYSARMVLPPYPAGVAWNRVDCGLDTTTQNSSTQGIGHIVYYGVAFYLPAGETLTYNGFDGLDTFELHTNFVSAAPIAMYLHTGPTSEFGNTGNSFDVTLESGACYVSATATHHCSYISTPFKPGCTNGGGSTPPSTSNPKCNLPATYGIPPGQLAYGSWNRVVCGIDWESAPTGSVSCFYKNANTGGSWLSGGGGLTGVPTMQWSSSVNCNGTSTPCPAAPAFTSYHDDLFAYVGQLTRPFQINWDNEVFGTTLGITEAQLP